jgi:hypothetical protein
MSLTDMLGISLADMLGISLAVKLGRGTSSYDALNW